jgi:ubiquitin carboxyl-terminal hydrolase 4/11/15
METKLSEILEHTITICNEGYDRNISYTSPPYCEDNLTLIDCIREFLTLESIENTWFCKEHCNAPTYTVKQMQLCSLPPVLVIQLKRFTNENGYRRKLDTFVNFPLNELNLNDFLSDERSCANNAIYDLFAISNHTGSIHSGHYTAYARQEINGPWYEFNDENVYQVYHENRIVSKNAYLLVYIRRQKNNVQ